MAGQAKIGGQPELNKMAKRASKDHDVHSEILLEIAWEVCNQVGGIYTVIRSKAPAMMKNHGRRYCMVGPFVGKNILAELEYVEPNQDIFKIGRASCRERV